MRLLASLSLLLLPLMSNAAAALPSKGDVDRFASAALARNCDPAAPGMAVLVARGDQVLHRSACGRASLELDVPLAPEHVFRIGSVTKQFAAAAVLKLAEEGKLLLDDPLTRFVPGYPDGDAITVRMLLDHTSGIRSYTSIEAIMAGGGIMQDLSTAALIDSFKDEPTDFPPGQGWAYNNSGYVLVGAVIEAASGKSWHAYLEEAFFGPLGMDHTGYGSEAETVIPGHVDGYTLSGEHWARARYLSMTQPHAAGALVSTVDDLLKWNRALHEGRILRQSSYAAMTTPAGKAAENGYGFGIGAGTLRGRPKLEHGGGIFGFSASLLYLPEDEVSVAVLYNADAGRPGMLGTGRVAQLLAAYAMGRPYPEKRAIEVDEAMLRGYEGVYRIDKDGARVLRVAGGRLTSQRSGGHAYPLVPVGDDSFLFEEGFSRIVFERGADGAVVAMRFFPEDEGEGERIARSDEPLPTARTAIDLPRAALERIAGEYVFQGAVLTVFLDGDTPRAQLSGQPAFEIFAESASVFFLKVVDASLRFAPESGTPATVTLSQGGNETVFARKD